MKKTTKTLASLMLVLALSLTAVSSIASADSDLEEKTEVASEDMGHKHKFFHKNLDEETREALKEAITNSDYDAWYAIVSEAPEGHPLADFITEENFYMFAEMVQAKMNGDHETAREIREELGLKFHKKHQLGQ